MSHPFRVAVLVFALALGAAGCGNSDPTLPAAPSPTTITETFTGTVNVNGAVTHPFVVGAPSTITATLTTVSSGSDVVVGLSLGTWNGEDCAIVLSNDSAIQGKSIVGLAQTAGNFCLRIFDAGKLTALTSYQVTVTHQ